MNRRTFLALLATPAVAPLLQACGGSSTDPPAGQPVELLKSQLARSATTADDAAAATAAINALGVDLFSQLVGLDPVANVVFSPASIGTALAMTMAGARGTTLTEMAAAMHVADSTAIHHAMNALTAQLDRVDNDDTELSIANSLWGQKDFRFEQPFVDLLAVEYGAGMNLVDYITDANGARVAINGWVSDATNDRIPELLGDGLLTPDTRLTLVNAVYLKATWAAQFNPESTESLPFTTAAGAVIETATMTHQDQFRYAATNGWQAVELPYMGDLAMMICLPDDGSRRDAPFDELAATLEAGEVIVTLPKFDIETKTELSDVLSAIGMATAFSDAADFSGITTQQALQIAAVVHQANITVDEEGTEAAAATAVIMDVTSAPVDGDPVSFTVDRPFVFALRHTTSGAVLFLGRVSDPSQTRSG